LVGCGGPDIAFVRDQYWKITEFDAKAEDFFQTKGEQTGKDVDYIDLSYPSNPDSISEAISDKDPQTAVLSPLFSRYAPEIAALESPRRIIAFGLGAGNNSRDDNLTIFVQDRREAYRQAGLLCRRYLEYPGNEESRVGGLFYAGGTERAAERSAFMEGLGAEAEERTFMRSFPRQNSIGEVNDFLSSLAKEPVGIFMVSMAGLSRDSISSVITRSRALIIAEQIADTGGVFPFEDRIIASIQLDWMAFFSVDLSRAGPEIVGEASLSVGPAAASPSAPWAREFFIAPDRNGM
jgi:hypothetical protein